MDIKLPNLGENIESGDVLSLLVQEGEQIEVDQGLMELETDKATVEVPSPIAGRVTKLHVGEGDTVSVGAVIVSLEPADETAAPQEVEAPAAEAAPAKPAPASPPHTEAPEAPPAPSPTAAVVEAPAPAPAPAAAATKTPQVAVAEDVPGDGQSSAAAGPAVRRLARELGVDLRRVHPTGAGGRITREDVQAYVRESHRASPAVEARAEAAAPPSESASDEHGPVRRDKMSRMRQTIARNMMHSYSTIPQLTNFDDVDITELEEIRQESKADYARKGIKLTSMPFLTKAVASALKLHPVVNASIDEERQQIIYKEYVNIGIAVDTDRGLVVPVLRDVDRMSIPQIAHQLVEMAEKVRTGDFSLEDLRGGTFTISNLGAIGGSYSTPIINPPEVAILLVGRARIMPFFEQGAVVGRLMLPLSLSYDHRVVDGAAAARFLNEVKGYLSAPGRLLLAP